MSKLVEKLKQVSQDVPQPMGFRRTPLPEKSRILLVASVTAGELDDLANRVAGADAGLVRVAKPSDVEAVGKAARSVPDIPWGAWLGGAATEILRGSELLDFLVFSSQATLLPVSQNDKRGKILEIDASLGEGLLRAVNKLPVDGVLLANGKAPLTWRDLMLFQHFAGVLSKPLLVSIPSGTGREELQAVWNAGIDGVITDVIAGASPKALRSLIEKLDFPSPEAKRLAPVLPRVRAEEAVAEEEEEDE